MSTAISSGKIGPYKWAIYPDYDTENPLECEELTIFPYWHSRYILGKVDGSKEYGGPDDFLKVAKAERYEFLPVFAYIHSGVTVRTSPYSCGWDSGQVGFIAIAPEDGRRGWGRKWREQARKYMEAVVKGFASYLEGECYRYEITRNGENVDGCGGFIGDLADVESEARAAAAHLYQQHQSGKEFAKRFMCC